MPRNSESLHCSTHHAKTPRKAMKKNCYDREKVVMTLIEIKQRYNFSWDQINRFRLELGEHTTQ